ncbi:MAG: flagellar filament capping protein FliD [Candidatus Thiodiazotropha sp. (ex Myrtea spinifera)]|nr:flagellar filament capping protein FliD [Candidatus Thiodiazotropha sp. (ex Myrtea spinifera)]MCU7827757.1 flagellar filament capping protein FliD [Candidatus Thiodiazotropha sp. (ex Myrtea sp. 'scaly one' KF741663)]
MATISAAGIGSGLEIESIITSLMEVEQIPLQSLQVKAGDLLTQVSAYGTLRSALATFQDSASALSSSDSFNFFTAASGDEEAYSVTADNDAAVGSYSISVDNLAAAHKLGSTTVIANSSTLVGNAGDQMTITIGTESFTVDIGARSLSSIQDLINEATDNVGVSAGIVQESDTSVHLVLTSENTGLENQISVAFTDDLGGAIADPLGMAQIQAADDAQITIDNTYVISRSSNTIDDAIEGVSIQLLAETTATSQLTVSRDAESISGAVSGLVESYNSLMSSISELRNGELNGDATLRLIENQVRSIMGGSAGVDGAFKYASQAGITFEKDGTLSFDSTELSAALETDRGAVVDLFTNEDNGLAARLDSLMESMLSTSGLIDAREDGLNSRVDSANDQIERMQYRLELTERRYRAQYTALDTLLGQLQSTSQWLTGQLDSLSNLTPGNRNNN